MNWVDKDRTRLARHHTTRSTKAQVGRRGRTKSRRRKRTQSRGEPSNRIELIRATGLIVRTNPSNSNQIGTGDSSSAATESVGQKSKIEFQTQIALSVCTIRICVFFFVHIDRFRRIRSRVDCFRIEAFDVHRRFVFVRLAWKVHFSIGRSVTLVTHP